MPPKSKRSRTGCETCRGRKVKCDEKHPSCEECKRLRLACKWVQGKRPSIKSIRRGYGPVKSRDETWTPHPIVPTPLESSADTTFQAVTTAVNSPPSQSDWSGVAVSSLESTSDDWWQELSVDSDSLGFEPTTDDVMTFEDAPKFGNPSLDDLPQLFTLDIPANEQASDSILGMFLSPALSDFHMNLANSLTLSAHEHEALRHYQTTYSLYRTTKDPNWSTHRVLLNLGSQDTMIMHLLLAVSLNDYGLRSGQNPSSQVAENHFQTGAQQLISKMNSGADTDNVVTMAAFFFIYLYMSKRKSTALQRLSQLSQTVLNYVRKQDLVARCIGTLPLSGRTQLSSSYNRSLLARLIMWTLDEDVKCSFQGTGGHFARYLAKRSGKTKDVYDASRNALGDHWGTGYPHSQMLDDDQNSTVLEFLWAMMPLWQDINDLSPSEDNYQELNSSIEQKFAFLEEKYSSVFRHSSMLTKPRPRILVNADYDVVLFNALRVYHFRSTIMELSAETPPEIQTCLKTILTIIQRTFTSRSTELHDRLQWPLFLAGIETNDTIYREWIFSRLTSDRVSIVLQQALDAQEYTGKRLRMVEIRNLLYKGEVVDLPASSTTTFIGGIPAI